MFTIIIVFGLTIWLAVNIPKFLYATIAFFFTLVMKDVSPMAVWECRVRFTLSVLSAGFWTWFVFLNASDGQLFHGNPFLFFLIFNAGGLAMFFSAIYTWMKITALRERNDKNHRRGLEPHLLHENVPRPIGRGKRRRPVRR